MISFLLNSPSVTSELTKVCVPPIVTKFIFRFFQFLTEFGTNKKFSAHVTQPVSTLRQKRSAAMTSAFYPPTTYRFEIRCPRKCGPMPVIRNGFGFQHIIEKILTVWRQVAAVRVNPSLDPCPSWKVSLDKSQPTVQTCLAGPRRSTTALCAFGASRTSKRAGVFFGATDRLDQCCKESSCVLDPCESSEVMSKDLFRSSPFRN